MRHKLNDLPTELLDEIAAHVSYYDKFSLCRVSKVLNTVCYRQLYGGELGCMSFTTTVKLCRTLCNNKFAASAVRTITFALNTNSRSRDHLLKSLYMLIHTTLKCIKNLEFLGFYLFDSGFSSVFDECVFPYIRTLRCHQPLNSSLASFLRRHPSLDKIELTNVVMQTPQLFAEIQLPALTEFYGPSDLLPMFLSRPSIRSATIIWQADAKVHNPRGLLAYFTSSSYRLNYWCQEWSIELASIVAQYIPDVSTLRMYEYLPASREGNGSVEVIEPVTLVAQNAVLKAMGHVMPLCSKLKYFEITHQDFISRPTPILRHLDNEFRTVVDWGRACPTLCKCRLPSGVLWIRHTSGNVWYPAQDPRLKICEEWLIDGILTGTYPFADQFMNEIARI